MPRQWRPHRHIWAGRIAPSGSHTVDYTGFFPAGDLSIQLGTTGQGGTFTQLDTTNQWNSIPAWTVTTNV
jgi:hypothetical protein